MKAVAGLTKKVLDSGKGYALDKAAEFASELAGKNYNRDLGQLLKKIKNAFKNDKCYTLVEEQLQIILKNYNFHKWPAEKADSVVEVIVAKLRKYAESIIKEPADLSGVTLEISEAVKKELRNEEQDALLLAAINKENISAVRECLALGADASKYIYLTIGDSDKTHLLECLLRAGVNPATTFYNGKNHLKKNFNLIAYAADCQDIEAVEILLGADRGANIAAYYPKQIDEALQGRVENSQRKSNGGSALTVALMQAHSDDSVVAKNIAKLLLRAGSHLNIVKTGHVQEYPGYNNLQLIVHFAFVDVLYEALNHQHKSIGAKHDLFDALIYCGTSKLFTSSYKTADVLAESYLPDMVQVIRDVRDKLALELKKKEPKGNLNSDWVVLADESNKSPAVQGSSAAVVTVSKKLEEEPQVRERAPVSEIKESDTSCCGMFGTLSSFLYFRTAKAAAQGTTQVEEGLPAKMKME